MKIQFSKVYGTDKGTYGVCVESTEDPNLYCMLSGHDSEGGRAWSAEAYLEDSGYIGVVETDSLSNAKRLIREFFANRSCAE